jgi:hypothetical protein
MKITRWHVIGKHTEYGLSFLKNNGRSERATRSFQVTDFDLTFDLSGYMAPAGIIYAMPDPRGTPMTVQEHLNQYLSCTNLFKSITLRKNPVWNFEQVKQLIEQIIRSRGYPHHVHISFPTSNNVVTVYSDSMASKTSRSCLARTFCVLSCLWMVALPLYYSDRKNYDGKLRVDFQVSIPASDWYSENYWTIFNGVQWQKWRAALY